jgi:hypothetical protein
MAAGVFTKVVPVKAMLTIRFQAQAARVPCQQRKRAPDGALQ